MHVTIQAVSPPKAHQFTTDEPLLAKQPVL